MAGGANAKPRPAEAEPVLVFWFDETKPSQWFRRDPAFDDKVCKRFGALHAAACAGKLENWRETPRGALALIILLDQFSRNIHRDQPEAFTHDPRAVEVAEEAIKRKFDLELEPRERVFVYMPLMHSEDLRTQERCVSLFKERLPGSDNIRHAEEHCEIIRQFGRFPHRNKTLGRVSTDEEEAFLKGGGFNP